MLKYPFDKDYIKANKKYYGKVSGIYFIINNKDNNKYIGQSINIYNRLSKHLDWLKSNNCHNNKYLQKAFDIDGERNFFYSIIEIIEDIEILINREIYYINSFPKSEIYNISNPTEFLHRRWEDPIIGSLL